MSEQLTWPATGQPAPPLGVLNWQAENRGRSMEDLRGLYGISQTPAAPPVPTLVPITEVPNSALFRFNGLLWRRLKGTLSDGWVPVNCVEAVSTRGGKRYRVLYKADLGPRHRVELVCPSTQEPARRERAEV